MVDQDVLFADTAEDIFFLAERSQSDRRRGNERRVL